MSLELEPGNAVGCAINSHRAGWNGTICKDAASWNCGQKQDFREDYCARGDDRCFHLSNFDEPDPHFTIEDRGGSWLFDTTPEALRDQVVLLWGKQSQDPAGIRQPFVHQLFGAYRVKSVEPVTMGWKRNWVVRPHLDAWTRFQALRLVVPSWTDLRGPYLKSVEHDSVVRIFDKGKNLIESNTIVWDDARERERFERFAANIRGYLKEGAERLKALRVHLPIAAPKPIGPAQTTTARGVVSAVPRPAVERIPPDATSIHSTFIATDAHAVLEGAARQRISARHGEDVVTSVIMALATKPLLIVQGTPGSGKSDLATQLLEDAAGERTLIVPVAATWRGREDLLGYVSPLDNLFQPTRFTQFLRTAALAFDKGDRRTRIVVFEEFNLSQPEHWLSDILVRGQYAPEKRVERSIELGGAGVRGWPEKEPASVFLAPTVRFVATVNTDHSVRQLSPRILDRASTITLTITAKDAARRVELELHDAELTAITELSHRVGRRGAGFSYRTALSLKACLERMAELGLDRARIIDLVLAQEVLSKIRLIAADPSDRKLCEDLQEWVDDHAKDFATCARKIAEWSDLLESGEDLMQA